VTELLSVYGARRLSMQTTVVGLLGPDVDHAALRRWNEALRRQDQDRVVVPFVVADDDSAPETVSALRTIDVRALVVGPQFEEIVGQALDEIDSSACRHGRVNLIEMREGHLVGAWVENDEEAVARLDATTVLT
jgi:shikimate 5-dehydrogenase